MHYYSQGLASFFKKIRPITSIALALVMIIQAFGPGAFALQTEANTSNIPKINICHATNSQQKPWEAIPINQSAWNTHEGHGDFLYNGPVKQNGQPDDAQGKDDTWCLDNSTGTLIVKKSITGPAQDGLNATMFSFQIDGGTATAFQADGAWNKGKNTITLAPGTYDVTEVVHPHFTPTYTDCTDIVITRGSTKTCTITNTYVPTPPPVPTTAKISATKIVCDTENLLPDWATGGPDVTSTTATEFLASTPERAAGCRVVPDWKFQWAPESATDAGGSFIGSALAPWVTFGPTDANGIATVDVPLQNVGSKIWVREELKNGFLGFSFDGDNDNTTSAEIYCDKDVLNYDNYDFIQSPVAGTTYHCVAFNVKVKPVVDNTCIIPNNLGDKSAFTLGVSPEPQLANIFTDHSLALDPIFDQENTQVWDVNATSVSTTFEIELLAKYAGNNQVFGYYKKGDTTSFTPVFRVGTHSNPLFASLPELSPNGTTTVTISAPVASIGFALDTNGTSPARYYSETSLNADTSDHVAVYNPASNTYVVAFEDLPQSSWDKDHNDLVVKIKNVTCEACEPQQGEVVSGVNTKVTSVQVGVDAPVLGNNPAVLVIPTSITDGYWSADDAPNPFGSNAKWIWSEDPVTGWTVDKVVTFEESFNVTGTATGAKLIVAADNSYEAYVNGVLVGQAGQVSGDGHMAPPEEYGVSLNPGINTLKIVVKNWAQAGDALNNPGGLIYKLTWSVQCGGGPTDPAKAQVFVKKYFGQTSAENAQLPQGTDFNIDITGIVNGNAVLESNNGFSWSPADKYTSVTIGTPVSVAERTTTTGTVDPDVLPIGASCVAGKYRLVGYQSSLTSFADALTQPLSATPSWSANVQGNTYVVIQNEACPVPQVAGVTVCKVDETSAPLSGWTMVLLGTQVQDDLVVDSANILGANSVALTGGTSYVAHATGSWTNQGGNNPADAEYSQPNATGSWVDMYPGFVSDVLELRIANEFGNWGAYTTAHSYYRSFTPVSDGVVNFGIFDGENNVQDASWFGDNSGSINVDIYEGYAGVTGQDGCVTFTDVPYGTYTLDEQLQDGWKKVSGTGSVIIDSATEAFTVMNTDEVDSGGPTDPGGPTNPPTTPTPTSTGGGGNWSSYRAGLVAGASDTAPEAEVLGATDELPGLPNTGNGPMKTTGNEALFVYGTIILALVFGNVLLVRARE